MTRNRDRKIPTTPAGAVEVFPRLAAPMQEAPATPEPTLARPTKAEISAWLNSKGVTLFGEYFTVTKNPDKAADWVLFQIESFLAWRAAQQ